MPVERPLLADPALGLFRERAEAGVNGSAVEFEQVQR